MAREQGAAATGRRVGPTRARHRSALAVFAAVVASSAWFGALGLTTGFLGLGAEVEGRLPFESPVVGGIALAVLVAVPSTVLAWFAWHDDPRTDAAALSTGIVLIGWIVVEFLFIRELSFFHPTYLLVGAILVWCGRGALHREKA